MRQKGNLWIKTDLRDVSTNCNVWNFASCLKETDCKEKKQQQITKDTYETIRNLNIGYIADNIKELLFWLDNDIMF